MGTMGLTGREGYSYGSMSVDARRKVNAYGNTVGVEPPWRTDFDPARPRGISGSAGPIAEYSPRQGIQRAMGAGRAYPSTVPPPPPQQAHDQTHLQYGVAPRTMNRSQAYAMAQQQQQQQLPPPQGYSPHAYPRQFNNRPPQPLPAPVPLQHQQHQQYDARQYGGAGGAGGSYPPPRSTSSMPLYARQSGGNNNYTSSPQLQSHEMDVSRFPLGGSDSSVGAGPNTYSQQQGLYQQRSSLPDRSGGGGGVGGSLGVGGDMHGFNDIMRDIDASLRLSEYTLPAADNGGGGVNGLTNTSFSTTISRPESDRAGANANPASSTQDDQKWY